MMTFIVCTYNLRTGAPVAEAFKAVSEMWDNQPGEGQLKELPTEIDEDQDWENQDPENQDLENLEFSENFYKNICESCRHRKSAKKFFLNSNLSRVVTAYYHPKSFF